LRGKIKAKEVAGIGQEGEGENESG